MRRQLIDPRQWHTVFAWFPVTTQDGQRVWLERVERQYWGSSWFDDYYHYRIPASAAGAGTAETRNVAQGEARQRGRRSRDAQNQSPITPNGA